MKILKGRKTAVSSLNQIGKTYGALTILEVARDKEKERTYCTAKCYCGKIKEGIDLGSVVTGKTRNCGCLVNAKFDTAESLIGTTINDMTLLEIIGTNKHRSKIGRFKCGHCGSETKEATVNRWKSSSLTSCGCKKRKKTMKAEDHIGITYGHLTLKKVTGKKGNHKTGLFHCSNCNSERDGMMISDVAAGRVRSCGCLERKRQNQIGRVYGDLKLLETRNTKHDKKEGHYECLLCGNHKWIRTDRVKSGEVTDCGCSKHHYLTSHTSYGVYQGMVRRCTDTKHKAYRQYGGRGISINSRWLEPNGQGLLNFMDDIGDHRKSKKFTLHRDWKYNDEERLVEMLEYGPDTCSWADWRQQNIEKMAPSDLATHNKIIQMVEDKVSIEDMATTLNRSVEKVEFYLSFLGVLKNYKYKSS